MRPLVRCADCHNLKECFPHALEEFTAEEYEAVIHEPEHCDGFDGKPISGRELRDIRTARCKTQRRLEA